MIQSTKPRLQQRFVTTIRLHHYSYKTEQTYWFWIRRYLKFHRMSDPDRHDKLQVEGFLSHLAVDKQVSPATQGIAFNALVFLFTKVLGKPLEGVNAKRATPKQKIPVVLSVEEVNSLLSKLTGDYKLMASLLSA